MKIKDKNSFIEEDDTDESEGQSGTGSEIHFRFRDAMSIPPRDDALPPLEIKRLLHVHKDLHKERVDKQKQTRKERAALKEGKLHLKGNYQQGFGQGLSSSSKYKKHPIANKAQFSGIDKQIIGLPSEYEAETNLENQEKLENRFENRLQNRNVPKFNPQFRPRGA